MVVSYKQLQFSTSSNNGRSEFMGANGQTLSGMPLVLTHKCKIEPKI
jgi:hypothetical protein